MKKEMLKIGDYVRFHTQHGHRIGLIENISLGIKGKRPQLALISVRDLNLKVKTYRRPLYKLRKVTLT
jgi:hypothetical protein